MRVALLGAGRIGRLHARLLQEGGGVSELLIADVDTTRARDVAAATKATAADSIDQAVERADALVITAATDAHAALIRAGAARGVPVFCEKPIALDLRQSVEVVADAERSGIALQIGFQRRFDAA